MKLTQHELVLLSEAVPCATDTMEKLGRLPTRDELKHAIHCGSDSASRLLLYFAENQVAKLAKKMKAGHTKAVARALTQKAVDKPFENTEEYLIRENAKLSRQIA